MQKNEILSYLKRHGSITAWEALRDFGCFRLAARVLELRQQGHDIQTTLEPHEGGKHARYFLKRIRP